LIDTILDTIAGICLRHARRILWIAAILVAAALGATATLSFDPDLLNLIPQRNRQVNEFRKVLRDMGTIDYHIVVLDLPAGHEVGEYESLVKSIGDGFRKSPLIAEVNDRVPNPLDYVDMILPKALLFLTPAEVDQVGEKLTDQAIRESVARNRALLQTPQSFVAKQIIQYDPFNLAPVFLARLQRAGAGLHIDASSGYYLSSDHTTLLIITKPRHPAQDVPFAKDLQTQSDAIGNQAVAVFRRANPMTPVPKISYAGGYSIALSDAELIKKDAIANILFSFFGVLALFLYAFRRAASIAYAALPMAMGLALTFGISAIVYGQLSQISASFAALLAGLGIDFITVTYGRYVDERNRGAEMHDAIRVIMRSTIPGVVLAAVTTAATFYAFLATDFRGMTQLGFLTGSGILLFLFCVVFLLPALIIVTEQKANRRAPKLYLHSFGSGKLIDFSVARPRLVIVSWSIFIVVCALLATRLRFSDNIQDLRAKGNAGVLAQERLTRKFGQSFDFMMYVVEGKTEEGVLDEMNTAATELEPLVRDHTIASYQSISTFLPPAAQQEAVIRKLTAGRNDRFSPARINAEFRAALRVNGFRPQIWDHYMELFAQTLTQTQPMTLELVRSNDLTKLLARYIHRTPHSYMAVTYIYPTGGRWSREVPPKLLAFAGRHPDAVLTGVNLVSSTLRHIIRADATRATLIGFVAVLILMFLSFRSLKMTLLSFVPFMAGAIGMLGLMALLNLEFNFMNIFVGLMIIGVATDYAIYMLQRYLEDHARFAHSSRETGKAVVMAAITAIVGYGSFAISHYPGLRSIGYASTFGIGLSGLAAITLLPAILVKRQPRYADDAAPNSPES
jgi:predicted RND superfamily exporter protein